jgi:FkbM family methyltransferase
MHIHRVERRCGHSFLARELGSPSLVVDLGANNGDFATWVAERFGSEVYGIEPDPEAYSRITQSGAVRVLPCAVGGSNSSAVLKTRPRTCSTLFDGPFESEARFPVEVFTFETLISLFGLAEWDRIDMVKVDIEGAEVPMFENAPDELLSRVAQFTVEFHSFIWPELSPRINAIKGRLRSLGFRMINFSFDDTDVLFLNRKLLDIGAIGDAYLRTAVKYWKYSSGVRRRAGRVLQSICGAP